MRYEGQGYDVAVALDRGWLASGDRDRIAAAFHAAHRAVYGHATEENEVWLKELRVHITGAMPRRACAPCATTNRNCAHRARSASGPRADRRRG